MESFIGFGTKTLQDFLVPPSQKVYVVDDDPEILSVLSQTLSRSGFDAELYDSCKQFLAAYDAERPGCILLDISMPEMDGMQLLEVLNEKSNQTPVIFLTGTATVGAAVDLMESSGSRTLKHKSNVADNDAFFFVYVNSTTGNATLAAAAFQAADDESTGADVVADAALAGVDLIEFAGITAVTGFHADNFDLV